MIKPKTKTTPKRKSSKTASPEQLLRTILLLKTVNTQLKLEVRLLKKQIEDHRCTFNWKERGWNDH